ncbi:hypothetical protein Pyn_34191 [Prunus yedoensis var. nudiflora]|uniref:Uncharacterized protein n=1 Tax=Prunus yedoensis var. nudiflora TaxID=2094558 RepID=A0A314UTY2_PRUYE|nr:hypothetical protein Pyn_34191 [Prunus yedoensis var. nudiflora]
MFSCGRRQSVCGGNRKRVRTTLHLSPIPPLRIYSSKKIPLRTLYLPSPYAPRIKRGLISYSTLPHVPSIARVLSAVRYCSVAATSSYQFATSIAPVIRRTREAAAVIIFVFQTK